MGRCTSVMGSGCVSRGFCFAVSVTCFWHMHCPCLCLNAGERFERISVSLQTLRCIANHTWRENRTYPHWNCAVYGWDGCQALKNRGACGHRSDPPAWQPPSGCMAAASSVATRWARRKTRLRSGTWATTAPCGLHRLRQRRRHAASGPARYCPCCKTADGSRTAFPLPAGLRQCGTL